MPDNEKQHRKAAPKDTLAKEIGKRIVEARTGLGFSQEAIHARTKWHDPEKVGISRAVLSLYETGVNKPGARELRILCETLKVTPNWLLYGSDSPIKTIQPSLEFLHGNDLMVSVELAYAMLALEPEEKEAFASLLFSLLSKKLGDIELSMLMTMARIQADSLLKGILETVGEDAKDLPLKEVIQKFIAINSEGGFSNFGNLRPAMPEDQLSDGATIPPPRKLKGQ
jgi:transcriptional regulator with XRE-family HTH domain